MAKIAVATLQTAWNCRWSRPGHRVAGMEEHLQQESVWVCVRTGERRAICEKGCEDCPHWEA